MLGSIGSELQLLQKSSQNTNVRKGKVEIPMCTKIGAVFQCYEGQDQNANVYKNRGCIPMFRRIRLKFQCLIKINRGRIPM